MNKQTSIYLMLTLIASIATMPLAGSAILPEAEAQSSISLGGTVKNSSGTGIAGATVYIEGYKTTFSYAIWKAVVTDSSGNWATTTGSGYTYTVMATKYQYSRAHSTQITTSDTDIDLVINPQLTKELGIFVVADDEFRSTYGSSWVASAWNKFTNKEAMFKVNWNIKFALKDDSGTAWNSPAGEDECHTLRADAETDTSWSTNHYNSDILVAITDQANPLKVNGGSVGGCADVPGSSGTYPSALVGDNTADVGGSASHEILHTYGHVYGGSGGHHNTYYYCTMSLGLGPKSYDQMDPTLDSAMAIGGSAKRNWY